MISRNYVNLTKSFWVWKFKMGEYGPWFFFIFIFWANMIQINMSDITLKKLNLLFFTQIKYHAVAILLEKVFLITLTIFKKVKIKLFLKKIIILMRERTNARTKWTDIKKNGQHKEYRFNKNNTNPQSKGVGLFKQKV